MDPPRLSCREQRLQGAADMSLTARESGLRAEGVASKKDKLSGFLGHWLAGQRGRTPRLSTAIFFPQGLFGTP